MDCRTAWENLEQAVLSLEAGDGDWQILAATAQAAIIMVLDYEPAEILAQAKGSAMPLKALARWMVHEGMNIPDLDKDRLRALVEHWNAEMVEQYGPLEMPGRAA